MELKLISDQGAAGTYDGPDALFAREFNESLVHQLVVAYQANARGGTPHENFSHKVNRRIFRAGICSILSQLAREDRTRVIDEFRLGAPKTRLLEQKLKAMGFDSLLVITDAVDQNLALSSRNLANVEVIPARRANPVALVRYPNVLLTKAAVAKLEEMLA